MANLHSVYLKPAASSSINRPLLSFRRLHPPSLQLPRLRRHKACFVKILAWLLPDWRWGVKPMRYSFASGSLAVQQAEQPSTRASCH